MSPLDALWHCMVMIGASSRRPVVGEIVAHARREVRDGLQRLTSDELRRMRFERWWINEPVGAREKRKFDDHLRRFTR